VAAAQGIIIAAWANLFAWQVLSVLLVVLSHRNHLLAFEL
jgi:hypothetical protein